MQGLTALSVFAQVFANCLPPEELSPIPPRRTSIATGDQKSIIYSLVYSLTIVVHLLFPIWALRIRGLENSKRAPTLLPHTTHNEWIYAVQAVQYVDMDAQTYL